jgi:Helix-turn-helix domain
MLALEPVQQPVVAMPLTPRDGEPPLRELTTTEAAAIVGVSPTTFRRYVRDDLIKPIKRRIGRSKLYLRLEVEALRERLRRDSTKAKAIFALSFFIAAAFC